MKTNAALENEALPNHALALKAVPVPPPKDPPTRGWWWVLALVFEPVELVRNVSPEHRPLKRHEWDDSPSKLGPRPPFGA